MEGSSVFQRGHCNSYISTGQPTCYLALSWPSDRRRVPLLSACLAGGTLLAGFRGAALFACLWISGHPSNHSSFLKNWEVAETSRRVLGVCRYWGSFTWSFHMSKFRSTQGQSKTVSLVIVNQYMHMTSFIYLRGRDGIRACAWIYWFMYKCLQWRGLFRAKARNCKLSPGLPEWIAGF